MVARLPLVDDPFWFPGRWIGGLSLVLAPLFLLTGALIRIGINFFFPYQLEAMASQPDTIFASYSFFLAGNILLWPAILTLTTFIGRTNPAWALWGGTFVMLGLFARTFHAGIDHFALQMVPIIGVSEAKEIVSSSYGSYHVVSALNGCILFGWILLAIGSYRSKTLKLVSSICLALMAMLMMGVLKGTSVTSVVALSGLTTALVPFGVRVLSSGANPGWLKVASWAVAITVLTMLLAYTGQLG